MSVVRNLSTSTTYRFADGTTRTFVGKKCYLLSNSMRDAEAKAEAACKRRGEPFDRWRFVIPLWVLKIMSTPSIIAVAREDGSYDAISCNWNGYPDDNGRLLLEHWTAAEKVEELVKLGDISALGEEVGEEFDFDKDRAKHPTWCHAYGRDRGEKGVKPRRIKSLRGLLRCAANGGAKFIYVWRADDRRQPSPVRAIVGRITTVKLAGAPVLQASGGSWLVATSEYAGGRMTPFTAMAPLTAEFIDGWLAKQDQAPVA